MSGEFSGGDCPHRSGSRTRWSSGSGSRTGRRGFTLHEDRLWLAVQASGAGHRGGRLVVGGSGSIQGSIDPTYRSWAGTEVVAQHGLRRSRRPRARRGGSEGNLIVPNLAVSLPEITAGGTRYAFQLSPASAIRTERPSERATSDALTNGRFARGCGGSSGRRRLWATTPCRRRPQSCDLSRGIRTDDETGTIVFHLRQPNSKLIRDAEVRGTDPARDAETGTWERVRSHRPAPYMIESYVPERALTLFRNPYFRVWSRTARPDGFPDEIEFRLDGSSEGVTAVERGRVDVASASPEQPADIKRLEDFRTRFASRVDVPFATGHGPPFLNTTRPPFDDVRARRAVNYAVDGAAIAESYGRGLSQPTCQLRPPGTVGFRRYCPYTAAPSQTGEWKAPDLTRGRRLVVASGTRGMRVTVWTYPGFWEQAAQGTVRALEKLGYRASIRRARTSTIYFAQSFGRDVAGSSRQE